MNKILFSIPDFWNNFELNLQLLEFMQNRPEMFYEDVVIDSCYGSFPCIWNGGRYISGNTDFDNIEQTLLPFHENGISLRFTFTNSLIDESNINDTLGNAILKLADKNLDGVTLTSPILAEHIKKNYPGLYIVYSTTLEVADIQKLNEISATNIIIPDYNLNNHFDKLSQLQNPQNIELLVGEACIDHCPYRKKHYVNIACSQMMREPIYEDFVSCPHVCEIAFNYYDTIPKRHHYISIDDIREKYLPMGINKFKISGRKDSPVTVIERYVNYLVKPEYKDTVRHQLLLTLGG